jgi:hypothetical protein
VNALQRAATVVNRGVAGLMDVPVLGPRIRRSMTHVHYTGRRSGRSFTTPVAYRRSWSGAGAGTREVVTIDVVLAGSKNWWRNFTGAGGPAELDLPEGRRVGHATSWATPGNRARVRVVLDRV